MQYLDTDLLTWLVNSMVANGTANASDDPPDGNLNAPLQEIRDNLKLLLGFIKIASHGVCVAPVQWEIVKWEVDPPMFPRCITEAKFTDTSTVGDDIDGTIYVWMRAFDGNAHVDKVFVTFTNLGKGVLETNVYGEDEGHGFTDFPDSTIWKTTKEVVEDFGVHDGGDDVATLADSTKSWDVDEWIGATVYNVTDKSSGLVTDSDATTVTATLSGGTNDSWYDDDVYVLVP